MEYVTKVLNIQSAILISVDGISETAVTAPQAASKKISRTLKSASLNATTQAVTCTLAYV